MTFVSVVNSKKNQTQSIQRKLLKNECKKSKKTINSIFCCNFAFLNSE